jgi:hypothetical protein
MDDRENLPARIGTRPGILWELLDASLGRAFTYAHVTKRGVLTALPRQRQIKGLSMPKKTGETRGGCHVFAPCPRIT